MMWWGGDWGWGAWLGMSIGMLAFWGILAWAVVTLVRGRGEREVPPPPASAEEILALLTREGCEYAIKVGFWKWVGLKPLVAAPRHWTRVNAQVSAFETAQGPVGVRRHCDETLRPWKKKCVESARSRSRQNSGSPGYL